MLTVAARPLSRLYYRDERGRFRKGQTPLERFLSKCRFDAISGCVIWCGGKTRGRGKNAWYGSFWFEGRRWTSHRWAAKFIHDLEIAGLDVDHKCCNTLCVHHLQAIPGLVNSAYYWIRIEKGVFDLPEPDAQDEDGIPFYLPPVWFSAVPPPPRAAFLEPSV